MPSIFDIFKTAEERKIICENCKAPIESYSELIVYATLGSFLFFANPWRERLITFHKSCFEDVKNKAERTLGIIIIHSFALFPIPVTSRRYILLLVISLLLSTTILIVEIIKLPPPFELNALFLSGFAFLIFLLSALAKHNSYFDFELPLKVGLKGKA